jgi:hypothetical protein
MRNFLILLFLSFFINGYVYGKNTKLIKEEYYSGSIKWNFLNYMLPDGEWKYYSKSNLLISTISIQCIEFLQIENQTWKSSYNICEIRNGGKHAHLLGQYLIKELVNGEYDNCQLRPEYFYAKLYTKGISMNCFKTRHFDIVKELNNPDDPSMRGQNAYQKKYFLENGIKLPKTAIGSLHLFYSPSINDKGIEISHLVNPEFFGQSKTLYGTEIKSEYHRENINNFPKKLKFMKNWTKDKAEFHIKFEKKMKAKNHQKLNFDDLLGD